MDISYVCSGIESGKPIVKLLHDESLPKERSRFVVHLMGFSVFADRASLAELRDAITAALGEEPRQ